MAVAALLRRDSVTEMRDMPGHLGAPVSAAGVSQSVFEKPDLVYQIGLPPRRVDVLTSISGVSFEQAWASRVSAILESRTIHFIGRDMFLRNKLAAGRPKDLADAARLKRR